MPKISILSLLSEWTDEFNATLIKSESHCVALFSTDKELLFANSSMSALFKGEPCDSLMNPTFDNILLFDNSTSLIFNGFLTLGDYSSVNTSLSAQIYRKGKKLLVVGGVNATQLLEQNVTMHQLNQELGNLQRELLKGKQVLENTLNMLNNANTDLKKLNATKDKFFSIMSHDLRSPFSSIIGYSEILLDEVQNQNYSAIGEYATVIQTSSWKAMNLLTNLIEWSRSQSGRMLFSPTYFEIVAIINEVTELLNGSAQKKSITILSEVSPGVTVFADKAMISTILRNLVSNSIKYTNQGGLIIISAAQKQNELMVTIHDNGVGIKKETIEKLFRIEECRSTNGTHNEVGTGLGLLLCKEFVEKHSGKIWVESLLNKGSEFHFTIPNQSCISH